MEYVWVTLTTKARHMNMKYEMDLLCIVVDN